MEASNPATWEDDPLKGVSLAQLFAMQRAGREYREARRVLERADLNLVGEVLRGHGDFVELEHYPPEDVFDSDTASQYYYHAHRGLEGEHGHFHAFVRTGRLPVSVKWRPSRRQPEQPVGPDAIAHLVAISMDAWGWPIGLFVTNRWVTGETWYSAEQLERLLPLFEIDHAWPSLAVNQALGALLRLFRPQIIALMVRRDEVLRDLEDRSPGVDVLEDRSLDVLAGLQIDVDAQIAAIDDRLRGPLRPSLAA